MNTCHPPRRLTRREVRLRYPRHAPVQPDATRLAVICCEREATEPEGAGHDPDCTGRRPVPK